MFVYAFSKAIKKGYLVPEYYATAKKGYDGVINSLTYDEEGRLQVGDICIGTWYRQGIRSLMLYGGLREIKQILYHIIDGLSLNSVLNDNLFFVCYNEDVLHTMTAGEGKRAYIFSWTRLKMVAQ